MSMMHTPTYKNYTIVKYICLSVSKYISFVYVCSLVYIIWRYTRNDLLWISPAFVVMNVISINTMVTNQTYMNTTNQKNSVDLKKPQVLKLKVFLTVLPYFESNDAQIRLTVTTDSPSSLLNIPS